jgi:hypothetical protein
MSIVSLDEFRKFRAWREHRGRKAVVHLLRGTAPILGLDMHRQVG